MGELNVSVPLSVHSLANVHPLWKKNLFVVFSNPDLDLCPLKFLQNTIHSR